MPPERRAPPRVVPTLTAVVEPQALASIMPAPPAPAAPVAVSAPFDVDSLVRSVMQRLDSALTQGLQARVEQLMAEQSVLLVRQLRDDIEPMVRDIVATELARTGQHPIR